jgi:type II secretory pathway component PulF
VSVEDERPDQAKPLNSGGADSGVGSGDLTQIAAPMADMVEAGLPLAPGLRALAEEVSSRRLRRSLIAIAERLDLGESLSDVLRTETLTTPRHLAGLIEAGVRSGNLGLVIQQFLDATRENANLRMRMWSGACYSLFLFGLLLLLGVGFMFLVVPHFREIYLDFGTHLPMMTIWIIETSRFVIFA